MEVRGGAGHAHIALADFDVVIVDTETSTDDVARLRDKGISVLVAAGSTSYAVNS